MAEWNTYIELMELSPKRYHLEYDDRHIAYLTKEQYESFRGIFGQIKKLEKRIGIIQSNRDSIYNQKTRNNKRIKELEVKNTLQRNTLSWIAEDSDIFNQSGILNMAEQALKGE